ncbi:Zinc finger protein 554 [Galemys pyrenaicus]|uniref:Zinc finger protein 554 n=1 Tax=Galemys pyrenaicus TaxID=202257 RepID=A0A8J6B2P2_GALPY|nr:Zinc finger protein 554 [Galemys pyrenaicus]
MNITELFCEDWECEQLENHDAPQSLLMPMAFIQVNAFGEEETTEWHDFGDAYNMNSDVSPQGASVGKNFHDHDIDIECLASDSFLGHHPMGYTDPGPCVSNKYGRDISRNSHLIQHRLSQMSAYPERAGGSRAAQLSANTCPGEKAISGQAVSQAGLGLRKEPGNEGLRPRTLTSARVYLVTTVRVSVRERASEPSRGERAGGARRCAALGVRARPPLLPAWAGRTYRRARSEARDGEFAGLRPVTGGASSIRLEPGRCAGRAEVSPVAPRLRRVLALVLLRGSGVCPSPTACTPQLCCGDPDAHSCQPPGGAGVSVLGGRGPPEDSLLGFKASRSVSQQDIYGNKISKFTRNDSWTSVLGRIWEELSIEDQHPNQEKLTRRVALKGKLSSPTSQIADLNLSQKTLLEKSRVNAVHVEKSSCLIHPSRVTLLPFTPYTNRTNVRTVGRPPAAVHT